MQTFIEEIASDYMRMKGLKYISNKNLNGLKGKETVGCFAGLQCFCEHERQVIRPFTFSFVTIWPPWIFALTRHYVAMRE